MKTRLTVQDGAFTFEREGVGIWKNISFGLNGVTTLGRRSAVSEKDDVTQMMVYMSEWEECITFRFGAVADSLIVKRIITNTGSAPLELTDIQDGLLDDSSEISYAGIHEYTVRYIHTSNVRTEKLPRTRPEYPYVRQVPYEAKRFNIGEGNDFPAFILTGEDYSVGLVEGDLNQTRFERCWDLGLEGKINSEGALIKTYVGNQRATLSAKPITLGKGESIEVSSVYYQFIEQTHPQDAYEGYMTTLESLHVFQGPTTPMLHNAVFCTWNYGTLHNIDENLLAIRAKALAAYVPGCKYFLIDDGFQQDRNGRNGPLDCFYPNPVERYDRTRFPSGMKAMAERIKSYGLLPAIWISPSVYLDSPLAREHPEWLLCDDKGHPGIIGNKISYLDLSVDGAKEFFLEFLDALLVEWGYRGVKFDFMTQWFTLGKARFRNGGTGASWRDWVFAEIRKRIGNDGFFMTCIAMTMGNPFPGLNADCYRCGCDIHDGTWQENLRAVKATFPQVLLEGRRTFLLNMDSAGFGDVPENEQMVRQNWIFITQGIIELGGKVEGLPDHQISLWNKLLDHADRGHKVRCLDEMAFVSDKPPAVLMVDYPSDSVSRRRGIKKHIAFFNWSDEPAMIGVFKPNYSLEEGSQIADFWTGEAFSFEDNEGFIILPGRSSKLIEVN